MSDWNRTIQSDAFKALSKDETAALVAGVREIPVPPPSTGINAWIESEIERINGSREGWTMSHDEARELARGACLAIIADRETLIKNLRGAGYTVIEPSKGVQEI